MRTKAILLIALMADPLFALVPMGPTCTPLKTGQTSFGFEYIRSESDFVLSGYGFSEIVEDVPIDATMVRLGLPFGDRSEFFARFGLGEIEEAGSEFAWGLGLKLASKSTDSFGLGAIAQVTQFIGDESINIGPYIADEDVSLYEFQVGVGPTWQSNGISIYGGPMVRFVTGDDVIRNLDLIFDIEQDSEIGGFIGVSAELAEGFSLNGEYQLTADAWMIAVNLQFRFGKRKSIEPKSDWQSSPIRDKAEIRGYQGHIDPRTGKIEVTPKDRLKVDTSGEPVKDKEGNFIFEPGDPNSPQ